MNARALKFVAFSSIEDHFRQGWMTMIPNATHRHLVYGIEMKWICDCPVPGGFKPSVNHRVTVPPTESAHDRDTAGA
jgi:hypothetical protein